VQYLLGELVRSISLQYLNLRDTMAFDRPLRQTRSMISTSFDASSCPYTRHSNMDLGRGHVAKRGRGSSRREGYQSSASAKPTARTRPCLFRDLLKNRPRKSALKKKSSRMVGTEVSDQCDSVGNSNVSASTRRSK
jgi:hypothetical protein